MGTLFAGKLWLIYLAYDIRPTCFFVGLGEAQKVRTESCVVAVVDRIALGVRGVALIEQLIIYEISAKLADVVVIAAQINKVVG